MEDTKIDFIDGTKELIHDTPWLIVIFLVIAFCGHFAGLW